MINNERLRQWTTALRTTQIPQVEGTLVALNAATGEITGACCLGIGEMACGSSLTIQQEESSDWFTYDDHVLEFYVTLAGRTSPDLPSELHEWLGLTSAYEADVMIDWPTDLYSRDHDPMRLFSCSRLNDALNLTFDQIADVIDHFGVTE